VALQIFARKRKVADMEKEVMTKALEKYLPRIEQSVSDQKRDKKQKAEREKEIAGLRAENEKLKELYRQYTTGEAKYYHDVWCNASRQQPMGCEGCSCTIGHQIKQLQAEIEKTKEKSNEVFRHTMWLAMEFGKVLQERSDLQKELQAIRGVKQ
jgi:cell division protein FtsB